MEFLAHLVHHVLLRFEISSRCYGAISSTFRRKLGWVDRPPVHERPAEIVHVAEFLPQGVEPAELPAPGTAPPRVFPPSPCPPVDQDGQDSDFLRRRRRSWATLIARTWREDPGLSNSCGRPMKIVAALSSPLEDDVIERILRHLSLWDPPWLRPPKARGPPPTARRLPTDLRETIDPLIDDELYSVDEIPPEDG